MASMPEPPPSVPKLPRIGALFAGYGGLDIAASEVFGGSLAWYSEVDKGALKILSHRFPDVPNHGDITTVDWSQVEPVDILTGGSPCQDLSHAGRRAGMTEGTRSNLWVAMREAIAQLRPRTVVWENVRGAFSAAADSAVEPCAGCVGDGSGVHLRALGRVLGDLSDLGYDTRWHGLRAADVGAAHPRFRVFVIALDSSVSGLQGQAGGRVQPVVPSAGCRGIDGLTLLPTPQASEAAKAVSGQSAAHREAGGHQVWLTNVVHDLALLPTPKAIDGDHPGIITTKPWADYAPAITRWEGALGRSAPEPTVTNSKGSPQLSPFFVEWLMGLPAGWVTDVPDITRNEALRALGNGVVPQQAAAALRTMLAWSEVAA